ncbi:MAG: ParB N-terminal domain-containing protein [Clostridia bacterium]|nr:ParB N-terminal domain-containing protein [Clostridia bacterium]
MSIGKNSIARAVNATANQKNTTTNDNVITKFSLDKIGLLSVAKVPDDIDSVKSSVEKRGVLCPVIVAATPKGEVWLVDGYRRYYAAKELSLSQISAVVITAQNKSEANRLYTELSKTKSVIKETIIKETIVKESVTTDIHEEKFRVLHVKDHDLPVHLL